MIRRGWDHAALMAMPEADFGFWLAEQISYDQAMAEARRKAMKA